MGSLVIVLLQILSSFRQYWCTKILCHFYGPPCRLYVSFVAVVPFETDQLVITAEIIVAYSW